MTDVERSRKYRTKKRTLRNSKIAVIDFETDPFNNVTRDLVFPFLAVLHGADFEPIIIWEDDPEKFVAAVISAIIQLPGSYTIYAHNGGKFDFMFLIHKLRGFVMFKGRGIMTAQIGEHELRDSFHIIPEKLANFQKDKFDYKKLYKDVRHKHKDDIISYCLADCRYLLDIVTTFTSEHGLKLSIGQAAMAALRSSGYRIQKLGENTDAYIRQFFYGGRVECLGGPGHFKGDYKLYDVNSMYPNVMARNQHPIGKDYVIRGGKPSMDTVFIELKCKNYGAFVTRFEGFTTAAIGEGVFRTTIWEYKAAVENNLISDVEIILCIDCYERSTFERFVIPYYERRQITKQTLADLKKQGLENSVAFNDVKKENIFLKLLLNNAYGKFAQNPRRYKESYITDIGERPPEEEDGFNELPTIENELMGYAIWERPQQRLTFNNVGTAASITGAARADLMRAICKADDPIYCDTDSVICRNLEGVKLHPDELGAWDLEKEFVEVLVSGKKSYACRDAKGAVKAAYKGAGVPTWDEYVALVAGSSFSKPSLGPTLSKDGQQRYIDRTLRATAAPRNELLHDRLKENRI